MMNANDLFLHTKTIGSMPVINHFMERLQLQSILCGRLVSPQDAKCIMLLAKNILVSREPMYVMGEWAGEYPAELLGITDCEGVNDDRIGRTLERLFDADRSSLLT